MQSEPLTTETKEPELKRCWRFVCINGQAGNMIDLSGESLSKEQALIECRASLGPKVVRVE